MRRLFLLFSLASLTVLGAWPAIAQDPILGEVIVEGNTKTDRSVVDRVIGLEPGDPFPLETFDEVWDRLEDCGYFAFVDLDSEEDDQGLVTLRVTVEEERTARFTPYIRYSRRHKYLLGAAMRDVNLGGRGEILELQAIVYRIQRAQARFTKPWFLGHDGLSLLADAGWEQGGFVWRPFDYDQWQAHLGLRQTIAGPFYVEGGGGYESFEQKDDYSWTVDDASVLFPAERRNTWQVRGLVGVDTRDSRFYPTRGMFHTYALSYRFGGDVADQTTNELDLRGFVPLPGKTVLALHAYGRNVNQALSDEYVMRWGGPETVRGAPYAGREGSRAYLATAELRYPLFLMPVAVTGETVGLGLHAFTDVGDAFFPVDGQSDPRAMVSFGGGLHISLLSWQLRFEAAKERDHDWTFEFMDVFNF
jgi:outer membrane protein assembly factor BamA